ncbi:MAG: biopolymer transporter ExbD [Hyphomonas sp.]|uniref:ExbD/TolR family protein n=1 Tax=Hyphomonas sp. TaxID=87 RepID=UPI0017B585ED|nr:biopolymer transporter ExbD [Hyphomonas sp.]MBA3068010.1 biopolymer transporter ExbD [Hyphomonas sp.]MBU3920770.1 biopolymer transporter ExbD [Alphaproteobacteria bacterium]MBU4061348.1 biopolymer transporter ExbD [Alphaproteobacteria bacterium]MBU4162601.1 biopolymer transporter ExbD [Alphaproteobacteria bacterium]
MRGRKVRKPDSAEVDLTPMLDVVFILLIFFIVTSTFAREEAIGLEPPPPPAPPDQEEQEPTPAILILVDESNLISVNGRPTDISSVRANIERVVAESPESAVIIQAHPKAKSGVVVLIRDEAYKAGFTTRVNILITQT